MGTWRQSASTVMKWAWEHCVARELGIEFHKVEMKHFEELVERGFEVS
jgi:hypothetical protein